MCTTLTHRVILFYHFCPIKEYYIYQYSNYYEHSCNYSTVRCNSCYVCFQFGQLNLKHNKRNKDRNSILLDRNVDR